MKIPSPRLHNTTSFNTSVRRKNTYSSKWDFCAEHLSGGGVIAPADTLPMWVADMDFLCAPKIQAAVSKVAAHGIYGYSQPPARINNAVCAWQAQQHNCTIDPRSVVYTSASMTGLYFIITALTKPNDVIIVHQPTYPPLSAVVRDTKRTLVAHTLKKQNGTYVMNTTALERDLPRAKMLILCNPQNPTGVAYDEETLETLTLLCKKHDVLICSDDVHAGIVYPPYCYTSIHEVARRTAKTFARSVITLVSPNKTFNTAGIKAAMMIIPDENHRVQVLQAQRACLGSLILSPFAIAMMEAAYTGCAQWHRDLMRYLASNKNHLLKYACTHLPDVRISDIQATYLAWLDFTPYMKQHGISYMALRKRIVETGRVGLSTGARFGAGGANHMRLNFACPVSTLKKGLARLSNALY